MSLLELVVQALVQGITEFLPVSSAGHLILVREVLGWPDPGLDFDVAVHVGTLLAVVVYLRHDVLRLAVGLFRLLRGRRSAETRLVLLVGVATLPIVIIGYLGKDFVAGSTRMVELVAATTLGFGVLLYLADRVGARHHSVDGIKIGHALAIGIAQVLALLPGTSRSGITMTMARALGYGRDAAARFSFLISIPTIAGAGLLATLDLVASGDLDLGRDAALAAVLAFGAALATMAVLMRWIQRRSFTPFVVYRLALGGALMIWIYA